MHAGERCDGCARVTFPNKDTYFGGYQGDSKAGLGLYAFATGAAYLGQYKQVRRAAAVCACCMMAACLPGLLILPCPS